MPRHLDVEVEGHILDAAYRLWRSKGESGLTMRAVAREAETTTPTVYQRFRDKRDILEALRRRAQLKLFAAVEDSESIAQFCCSYLEFASKHQHEYELIHADWAARLTRDEPRPSFELLKERLADHLGGAGSSTGGWRSRLQRCRTERRHYCWPRECMKRSRPSYGRRALLLQKAS